MPVSGRPDRATLTHIDLDGQEFVIELQSVCSVGRADGNTIQIGDKRASKNHAEIRYESGQFVLRDLESANGTLVNGEYVVDPILLKHDDEIVIGRTMLLYTAPRILIPPADAALGAPTTPAQPAQRAQPAQTTTPAQPAYPAQAAHPAHPVQAAQTTTPAQAAQTARPAQTAQPIQPTQPPYSSPPAPVAHTSAAPGARSAPPTPADPAASFRVIQGTPAPVSTHRRPAPRDGGSGSFPVPPSTDDLQLPPRPSERPPASAPLFDSGRGRSDDLFDSDRKASDLFTRPPSTPDAALFGDVPRTDELFQPGPTAQVPADHDLFATAPGPDLFGDAAGPAMPATPLMPPDPLEEGQRTHFDEPAFQEPLEELEPFESLDDEPDAGWIHDPQSEAPAPLLENQPVIRPEGLPDGPDGATMAQPQSDDVATLMVSREDLFGRQENEPPRWGESDGDDVHPAFGAEPRAPEGGLVSLQGLKAAAEDLPIADVTLAAVQPPRAPSKHHGEPETLGPRGSAFIAILQVIRHRVEQVDIPEKGALLDATEVLSQHPYIRVVLESIED